MTTFVHFVEVDQVAIRLLCPAPGCAVYLAREDGYSNRNGNVACLLRGGGEVIFVILRTPKVVVRE
jgi:hypothetical protein